MSTNALKTAIPDSVLPYPKGLWNRIKYVFWRAITPGYETGLDLLVKLRILRHDFRQDFLFGKIAEGRNVEQFVQYLHTKGLNNHFIAWKDAGQMISLRKLEGFEWQYHVRIFDDGEVRGHYEYTPEAHPYLHSKEIGMQERRAEFLDLFGDWVVSK